jgi:hypothetical protein
MNDAIGIGTIRTAKLLNRRLHPRQGMLGQQLQHADELPNARAGSVPEFQPLAQFAEDLRQLPIAVHVGMIQSRRTTPKRGEIVQRIEHIIARVIAATMNCNDGFIEHDLHAIDITLDRHRLKRGLARHAIVHVVEPRELILVDLRRLPNAGIKPMLGQTGGPLFFLRKSFADRLRLTAATTVMFLQAALAKISVEFLQAFHPRHRRGPLSLQGLHAVFHHRLFIPPRRHAEQRLKHIVAGQGLIARIDLPRTPAQEFFSHGLGIIPPDFFRHMAEELKRLRHTFQDRLRPLRRQRDREREIGIRPHQDQHVDLASAFGKVHGNLAEVRFDPLTRPMIQRNERLAVPLPMAIHKPPHRVIAARVIMLVPQPLEDPHPRMPLLRRRGFILLEYLKNQIVKRFQLGSHLLLTFRVGLRLTCPAQNLANLLSRVMKRPGDLPETHAIAKSPTNPCIIVHREHPFLR